MRFRRLAWSVLAVNLFVILWGALVRASGSGAGCGRHWPLCNGEVLPSSPGTATLIELTHRITSGVALLLVAWLFGRSRREFPAGHPVRRWAAWSLAFIASEALVGAGLVLLALVGADASPARAGYLAVHLLNTFLLLGALALTAQAAADSLPPPAGAAPRALLAAGLGLLLLVGMSGAVTALGDTLFPARTLGEGLRADASRTAHFLVRLRVLHPLIAALTAGVLSGAVWRVARQRGEAGAAGRAVLALVLLQLALGVTNLVLLAPTALQLLHLLTADLLWIATVAFAAATWRGAPYRLPTIASANSLVRSSVAPSIRRWKS
ncbi:MAG TPA: COX15/CtaA family protein [Gemmatimonadales bacterium]|nr:COX15/CtaA family protein [Gemmatimonadales bacterium]